MTDIFRDDDRGLSEVIGYVMVFALILTGVIFISTMGLSSLEDIRSNEQIDNTERAFDVISQNIADIYQRGAPSRTTEIDLGSGRISLGSPIVMNISNESTVITEKRISPIVYTVDEDSIVYAGGAIFRTRDDSGVVLQKPPIIVNDDGIHVTLVGTRTRETNTLGGGTARIRAVKSYSRLAAYDTQGTHDTLWVNVTSPRSSLWEEAMDGPQMTCYSGSDTPTDVVACRYSYPDTVAVSVVMIDVSLSM